MTSLTDILSQIEAIEDAEIELPLATKYDLQDKIDDYYRVIKSLEASKAGLKAEIEVFKSKVESLDKKIDRIKDHLVYGMRTFGWSKIKGNLVSASIRTGRSVLILDDNPEAYPEFTVSKTSVFWDKKKIKEALEEKPDAVDFAKIKFTDSVNFR